MHNKILSLFSYNLESDFLKSILEEKAQINFQGELFIDFTKKFQDKNYYIFDTVSVRDFGQYSNIILMTTNFSIWNLRFFKKLINDLFKIYGADDLKGKYSILDYRDLVDKESVDCSIRNWSGIEKELLPCAISFERLDKKLTLTIFGAEINPEIKFAW